MNPAAKYSIALLWIFSIIEGIYAYIYIHNPNTLYICFIGAVVLSTCYKIALKDENSAYLYTSAISLILAGYFGTNFAKHIAPIMDGAMLIVSATTFAVVGLSWLNRPREEK